MLIICYIKNIYTTFFIPAQYFFVNFQGKAIDLTKPILPAIPEF